MKHPLSKSATFPRTACFGPVLCAALAGCGEAPPQVPPQPVEAARPKPRAALKLPPRVVPARSGTTEFLGKLGSKSVYSVGAERWVVDEPGKAEREAAPLGDLLFGVIPFAQGEVKALGWNTFRAFGFTDVLGAPKVVVESDSAFTRVRPGPNAMLLFGMWQPTAVDLSSGLEKQGFFPQLPVRDAVFLDGQRGAVAAAIGGIGVTTDGGRTWKSVQHRASLNPTLSLTVDGPDLFVRDPYTNQGARIDFAAAQLQSWSALSPTVTPGTTPIEGWITLLGNPIPSAVRNGIDAGGGTGLVARNGELSRVDLATGLFTETVTFEGGKQDCRGAMIGKEAYMVCAIPNAKRGVGEQLWRVTTAPKLGIEIVKDATFAGAGYAEIVGAASGGMMVAQGCGDKWGHFCARQPDGSFKSVPPENVPYRSGSAPLADGRIANVGVRITETGPLVELLASSDREKVVLQDVDFHDGMTIAVTRPEEGEDKVVRFLVTEKREDKKDPYYYLYAYEAGKKGFRKTALPDVTQVSFADGVLVTYSKEGEKLHVSHDFGATFQDFEMPKGASVDFTAITRLGVISSTHTRVGWEPLPPVVAPPRLGADLKLHAAAPPPKKQMELSCKTSGAPKVGQQLPRYDGDLRVAFGVKPTPKGISRRTRTYSASPMDPSLLLIADGKGGTGSPKAAQETWTARWLDPRELDPKLRTASSTVPAPDEPFGLRGVWAEGGKLMFTADLDGKSVLFRSKGSGLERAEVHPALSPVAGSPQAFSADGSVIAYLAGEILVVWRTGEAPRAIGTVNQRVGTVLGAPSKEGVPVLVDVEGQSYYRVFPIPADKLSGLPQEQWISGSWDGWTRGPSLFGNKGPVGLCDAKPAGSLFHATSFAPETWVRFVIDGTPNTAGSALRYDVVSDGHALCLQSLIMQPPNYVTVSVKGGGAAKPVTGLDTIRFVAKSKKGELTKGGRMDKTPIHAMTCEVGKSD